MRSIWSRSGRWRLCPALAAAALALILAGCGSAPAEGSPHPSPGGSAPTPARTAAAGTQQSLSACMRANGVPGFPDLKSGHLMIQVRNGQVAVNGETINVGGATFQKAMAACQKDMRAGKPPSAAQLAQMKQRALQFSACMRAHGVPNFPDPTFTQGGVSMKLTKGTKVNSPQFQAASKACQGESPVGIARAPAGAPAGAP